MITHPLSGSHHMKTWIAASLIPFALLSLTARAADPTPPAPTTQPNPAADRLTFLTLQLSSIEASLNAVNLALRGAGYKAVIISEKANQAAMGNELMDRKGGAPIAWDKFYGATAKEFAPRDVFGVAHNYERPSQFDYLYRANNEHIVRRPTRKSTRLGKEGRCAPCPPPAARRRTERSLGHDLLGIGAESRNPSQSALPVPAARPEGHGRLRRPPRCSSSCDSFPSHDRQGGGRQSRFALREPGAIADQPEGSN